MKIHRLRRTTGLLAALTLIGAAHAGLIDLGTLGGATSQAWGVRSDGTVVVGSSVNGSSQTQAFAYTANAGFTGGAMTALNFLSGGTASEARAVNASGLVVGYSKDGGNVDQAVTWTGVSATLISNSLGGSGARAFGVSTTGSVVGWARNALGVQEAFISTGGVMTSLDSILTTNINGNHSGLNSRALGVSANGRFVVGEFEVDLGGGNIQVQGFVVDRTTPANSYEFISGSVGTARATNGTHAVGSFFDAGGQNQNVAAYTFHGPPSSSDFLTQASGGAGIGNAINAAGAVAGNQDLGAGFRAVAWSSPSSGAVITDLNTLHLTANTLTDATGIADTAGIYSGNGTFGGQTHGYLLAVPEPSSGMLALPLLALAPLALRRRRSA